MLHRVPYVVKAIPTDRSIFIMAEVAGSVNKPSKSVEVLGVTLFLTIFGATFVLARLWARLFSLKSPGWDDILIAVALVCPIPAHSSSNVVLT